MKPYRWTRGLLGAMLVIGGCGPREGSAPPPPPPKVLAAPALERDVQEWDDYTGRLEAVDEVEVRARVSGYLESIHFTDGQIVKQGDLLFVIDPRPFQALVDIAVAEEARAKAQLDLAQNNLERAEAIKEQGAITPEEYDQRSKAVAAAAGEYMAAQARVTAAELDLSFTEVRSPLDGRVSQHNASVGNLISGGAADSTLLTTIVSLNPIHCTFTGSEQDYLKYIREARAGTRPSSRDFANPVKVGLADEEGFPHEGRMDFVDNQIDPSTGTIRGRAILDNDDLLLLPGMFVRVRLLGIGVYKGVLIPDQAIGTDQSQRFVYVLDDQNVARERTVVPGRIIDGLRVIKSGLDAGETVVIEGMQRVRTDQPVTPERTDIETWLRRREKPGDAPTGAGDEAGTETGSEGGGAEQGG